MLLDNRSRQLWKTCKGENELAYFSLGGLSINPNAIAVGAPLCGGLERLSASLCSSFKFLCALCASNEGSEWVVSLK